MLAVAGLYALLPHNAVLGQLVMSEPSFVFGALWLMWVFVWGFEPGIYVYSGRRPAARFFYDYPLMPRFEAVHSKFRDQLMADLVDAQVAHPHGELIGLLLVGRHAAVDGRHVDPGEGEADR